MPTKINASEPIVMYDAYYIEQLSIIVNNTLFEEGGKRSVIIIK